IAQMGINRTFQIPKPFLSLTVHQNVDLALHHSRRAKRDAREILSFVGLEAESEREAASLNTAQQKLLDLARALATEPRLLLVDELGAGLGPADLKHVAQKLRALADSGVALLVVEHLMGFLGSLTDDVVVMNAGVEIFAGRLSEAVREPKVVEVFRWGVGSGD
ncbi:branched-chain amino acid ABC transporter, ATP-binding protein, partial [mine drainage metagenome]